MGIVDTEDGSSRLARFLDDQIKCLIAAASHVRESKSDRVSRLYTLYSSIIEDAIAIRVLGDQARLNQAYIISRALLERLTNLCFLQLCTEDEFKDYIDYSLNKAARRQDRTIEANGKTVARISLKEGNFEIPPELTAAVAKFTSERGREKTRWTTVSLPDRVAVIEAKLGGTGLFMSLLTIYSDASEALHGTLYGASFHLGVYDIGSIPNNQETLDRHRHATLSCLYLMAGGAIDTMVSLLGSLGEQSFAEASKSSRVQFKQAAIDVGFAIPKRET